MPTQNSSNQKFTDQADGFILGGGTTQRNLTVTGGDVTLSGAGSNTYNYPASSDTLVGRASTDTLTNKTIDGSSNTLTNIPNSALTGTTNLLTTNPSFNSNLTGWTAVNGGSWTHDSGTGHTANGSASKSLSGVDVDFEATRISVTPGALYNLGIWVKGTNMVGNGFIRLELRTYNGVTPVSYANLFGTDVYETDVNDGTKRWALLYAATGTFDWIYLHGQFVVPSQNIDGIAMNVYVTSNYSSGTVHIDDAFIGIPQMNASWIRGLGGAIEGTSWYEQRLQNKTILDGENAFANVTDETKRMQFDLANVSTGTTRTLTVPNANGTIALTSNVMHTPTAVWGDGVNTASITTGTVCYVRVPYSGTISEWHIVANASCSVTLDVWKDTTLPTNADSITASAKPALSSATTASSSTLPGWTTSVSAGDIFGFELESLTGTPSEITLVLKVI